MTSPHDDPRFDWHAAEADLHNPGGPDADVVDLDAARSRRASSDELTDPDSDVDPGEGGPVLVDSIDAQRRPRFTLAGFRDAQRRPILPGWLRSRSEFAGNLTWATGLAGHGVLYHGLRVPKYVGKLALRAPAGLGRVAGGYGRWLFDLEGEPVRQAVVRAAVTKPEEAKTYETLSRRRDRRVRWRGLTAVLLAVLLVAGLGVLLLASTVVQVVVVAVAVVVFGVLGAPADRPLLDTAVVRAPVMPLTSDEVVRALAALNIPGINQALRRGDTGKRWFPAPITRENGTGWRADVELPRGVTASAVVEKREELAAALTRPLGCVWPEANAEIHPGRLVLFVADKDMSRSKQNPWPLLKSGAVDLFKPFPFGTDPRGRAVTLTLMFASMIVGSIPRMGKTFSLRLAMLGATLDPRAWVLAFDLKGTGDLSPLEPVCHRYRAGDEDDDIAYGLAAMREVRTELRRRTKVIRELPRDLCPENKVTPDLASTKRLGLQPIVIGVDECQVWFEHAKYGDEFEEICTDLIKRGPAAGITLILATQRPDAKSLPTGISANAVLRFCLKVMGHTENDMVLGTSMHKSGIKATMFSRRDRGIGYLAGEGDDPTITRTFYIDGPTAEQVTRRARALREKAGTLTGHAAGQSVDTTAVRRDTLLDDIAAIMSDTEAKLWSEVVCDRLTGLRPEVYTGLTREQLTAALKPHGVTTGQVWGTDPDTGKGANRRGIDRAHILTAITKRDRGQGGRAAG
ncbi:cell division protein FtsK [Micromonospora antibiotica]|uniref:Cell division protein FtsK n=1 Tax=Micromonospora antibiotica TaxID=2807623 RepID=A0ABS3V121_9ACTN|nr:cell division protein FtsK [Micromonospora antibiotica]MBO4159310.1 cell division protein FtsK [Micromonospora antibiotica]